MGMNTNPQLWNPTTGKYDQRLAGTNGAAHFTDGSLATIIVSSAGYTYIAEAVPGADATAAVWRCQKINEATGTTTWADGNGNFDNVPGAAGAGLSALTYL